MIIDRISNIEIYRPLSKDIYQGLLFLKNATPDIENGTISISTNVKVIIEEYNTTFEFKPGFEAHKHVIDIQYPIRGLERVKWSPIHDMKPTGPYDTVNDRTFYKNSSPQSTHVDIGNGMFAIMFPWDGHGPQHYIEKSEFIKKITIKVSI